MTTKHSLPLLGLLLLCACKSTAEPVLDSTENMSSSESFSSILSESSSSKVSSVPIVPVANTSLTSKFNLDVPFAPQSPFANWDDPYQEACEEMSMIMVDHFLQGKDLSLEDANGYILALVAWETAHGYKEDVTIQELADIAKAYYGYDSIIEKNVSIQMIKEYLVGGDPIIVPVAGRKLFNPYFSGEGPFFHMLVITGYDQEHFITNDPGTKRGEEYKYTYEVLMNAIHDWTGVKEEIEKGEKVMLILSN